MARVSLADMFREQEFREALEQVLPNMLGGPLTVRPRIRDLQPDYAVELPTGKDAIVEVAKVMPNTRIRVGGLGKQLIRYAQTYQEEYPGQPIPELILAVPETLSSDYVDYLNEMGIDQIIDGPTVRALGREIDSFTGFAEGDEERSKAFQETAQFLLNAIEATKPGRADWASYQSLCGKILSYLLCPPLGEPLSETSNLERTNRRDYILPNYSTESFWSYMRAHYEAHYIVVDAKNYVGRVKKKDVLQLSNYLAAHGAGLFGIVVSRNGADHSAEVTRREQWVLHRKMIIFINDEDLRQMMILRRTDGDPSDLIRQKIEDFRLGF